MTSTLRAYAPSECGPDGYPFEWHATIKQLIREQAGHRCVRCGHPYRAGTANVRPRGEWSLCDVQCEHGGEVKVEPNAVSDRPETWARWRILTVHHLDGDKKNCRWWNLLALCQRCHLIIQGKVDPWRAWPWVHSEWFRPYVAGFYGFRYLTVELTREETLERIDALLQLGREQDALERMPI